MSGYETGSTLWVYSQIARWIFMHMLFIHVYTVFITNLGRTPATSAQRPTQSLLSMTGQARTILIYDTQQHVGFSVARCVVCVCKSYIRNMKMKTLTVKFACLPLPLLLLWFGCCLAVPGEIGLSVSEVLRQKRAYLRNEMRYRDIRKVKLVTFPTFSQNLANFGTKWQRLRRVFDAPNFCLARGRPLDRHLPRVCLYHVRQKTAPFYICNSFVRTSSIRTIFGTHILQ